MKLKKLYLKESSLKQLENELDKMSDADENDIDFQSLLDLKTLVGRVDDVIDAINQHSKEKNIKFPQIEAEAQKIKKSINDIVDSLKHIQSFVRHNKMKIDPGY